MAINAQMHLWGITETSAKCNIKFEAKTRVEDYKSSRGKELKWIKKGEDFYVAYDPESKRLSVLVDRLSQPEQRGLKSTTEGGSGYMTPAEFAIAKEFYYEATGRSPVPLKEKDTKEEAPETKTEAADTPRKPSEPKSKEAPESKTEPKETDETSLRRIYKELAKRDIHIPLPALNRFRINRCGTITLEEAIEHYTREIKEPEKKTSKKEDKKIDGEEKETKPKTKKGKKDILEDLNADETDKEETAPILNLEEISTEEEEKLKTSEENAETDEEENESWQEKYLAAIRKNAEKDIDKLTKKPRRICKEKIEKNKLTVDLIPSKLEKVRREEPARYEISKSDDGKAVDIKMQAKQYKDFYILFKSAQENGVKIINLENTQTDEFRHLALAAALSLGMEVLNKPGLVDINVDYLEKIPEIARRKLETHNEEVRTKIEHNKEEYKKTGKHVPRDTSERRRRPDRREENPDHPEKSGRRPYPRAKRRDDGGFKKKSFERD